MHADGGNNRYCAKVTESAAFIRSDDPVVFPKDQYPNTIEDTTSGPGAPDLEIICTPVGLKRHGDEPTPGGQIGSMAAVLLRYICILRPRASWWEQSVYLMCD